jgi:hypothetical protein
LHNPAPAGETIVFAILSHTSTLPNANPNAVTGSISAQTTSSELSIVSRQFLRRSTTPQARRPPLSTALTIGVVTVSQRFCSTCNRRSSFPGGNKLLISAHTSSGACA